jgi:hypothetical protein
MAKAWQLTCAFPDFAGQLNAPVAGLAHAEDRIGVRANADDRCEAVRDTEVDLCGEHRALLRLTQRQPGG